MQFRSIGSPVLHSPMTSCAADCDDGKGACCMSRRSANCRRTIAWMAVSSMLVMPVRSSAAPQQATAPRSTAAVPDGLERDPAPAYYGTRHEVMVKMRTAAPAPPASFGRLPADDNWTDVRASLPGRSVCAVPTVFVSAVPAELIVARGAPREPVAGMPAASDATRRAPTRAARR